MSIGATWEQKDDRRTRVQSPPIAFDGGFPLGDGTKIRFVFVFGRIERFRKTLGRDLRRIPTCWIREVVDGNV